MSGSFSDIQNSSSRSPLLNYTLSETGVMSYLSLCPQHFVQSLARGEFSVTEP